MKASIERVEARTVSVPLETATSFSTRSVTHRDYVLTKVTTTDGHYGIGFCYGGSFGGKLVAEAVRLLFANAMVGADPTATQRIWSSNYQNTLLHGRTGSVMRAISILDTALWDRNARAVGLPLYKYLGAYHEGSVPAYASGGYYTDNKTVQDLADEVAGFVAMGFDAVKIKVGRLGEKEEEARVAAAREAIGPDTLLMLDANNAWSDLPTALRYVRRFEPYDPYWIEEPFSPDDLRSHARLAESTHISVATGEIEAGRWRFSELIERGGAIILQTDAAVCGGITEYRKITALAESFGIKTCPHWFHDLHVHLVAASESGQFVEFFPDSSVLNFRKLLDRQLAHDGGRLILPNGPGLGFDFDEAAIEKYAIEDWN